MNHYGEVKTTTNHMNSTEENTKGGKKKDLIQLDKLRTDAFFKTGRHTLSFFPFGGL